MPTSSRVDPSDLAACERLLAAGSKSFAAASLLLPRGVRRDAAIFYAFCRVADDAIDEAPSDAARRHALEELHARLDRVFGGTPVDAPVDRALSVVVGERSLDRLPFDALLEGFAWDVEERRYASLGELRGYAARVAGTVGVVMTQLMGPRDAPTLARACDLGVAMQLTNVARDVGEDARMGRVYLPLSWFDEASIDVERFLAAPKASPEVRAMTRRLVAEAVPLYVRSRAGIGALPLGCRVAIDAARRIYQGIHREIARADFDTVSGRRSVSGARKVLHVLAALLTPAPPPSDAPPLDEVRFLVEGGVGR